MSKTSQVKPVRSSKDGGNKPDYEPTPEQIKSACAEIQTEWTPAERNRRANVRPHRFVSSATNQVAKVPVYRLGVDLAPDFEF